MRSHDSRNLCFEEFDGSVEQSVSCVQLSSEYTSTMLRVLALAIYPVNPPFQGSDRQRERFIDIKYTVAEYLSVDFSE